MTCPFEDTSIGSAVYLPDTCPSTCWNCGSVKERSHLNGIYLGHTIVHEFKCDQVRLDHRLQCPECLVASIDIYYICEGVSYEITKDQKVHRLR